VLDALLTLYPLDTQGVPAIFTMEVIDDPAAVPDPVMDFAEVFTQHRLADCEIGTLERHAFYERAKRAFALVRTGEMRPYGNILLVKGVVNRFGAGGGTAERRPRARLRFDQRRPHRRCRTISATGRDDQRDLVRGGRRR
jgi:hypothetical protein